MGKALSKRIKQEKFESALQEAVLNLLIAASHVREKIDAVCSEYGITRGQYNVLRILRGAHPHGHPRGEIADRLLERAPDVTRLLDRLEEQGLAARDKSDEDRRLTVSRITSKGLALLDRMQNPIDAVHAQIADRISLRDRRELSRICEGLYGEED